ncbi:MAG: M15 family metallopeptidase [Saprospiraceae bacterium]|nr:M15 family metallopeptidase [Saprospiraceae bacterium]MCF8250864.1 M15 family metallopeptidase [Saprospiraceae bacterium]MCF8312735.1 M15 family metallopeptidase [Saprospiraceae bacterium]MCF8441182.1 M15 family metallopeptidase [Saprospiraceae bacterium]
MTRLDPSILLDLRYATESNFVKEKMYDCGRCFFRVAVAKALVEANQTLKKKGMGLKMYDCYRPRPIQWKLWNKVPDPRYVADPRKGSMHNRGMAADLTIVDSEGKELDMGTDFDFFGEEAYHAYTGHPQQVLDNRKLLKKTMADVGMKFTTTEWWHYSYRKKNFPIADWVWDCE